MENKNSSENKYFETIIKNLSDEERKKLYQQFSKILLVENDSQLENLDIENEKSKEILIQQYKLTILDQIVIFFKSIFGYFDLKEYIVNKEISKIVKKLNSDGIKYFDFKQNFINKRFLTGINNIILFFYKYKDFLSFFLKGFNEKITREKILLYFLQETYDENAKKRLNNLSDENIEKIIYENVNYKKRLMDLKIDFLKSLRGKTEEKFNKLMYVFYNFILFFNFDYDFIKIIENNFNEFIPLNLLKDRLELLLKKIMLFPFEEELINEVINHMKNYYKSVDIGLNIEDEEVYKLIYSIIFYIKDDKAKLILKIINKNPLYEYDLVRYKIDFFNETIKLLDSRIENKIIDIEKEIKRKERENIEKHINELNLRKYNFIFLEKEFNEFLEGFNLPQINFIEKIEFVVSFYFYVWVPFLYERLNKIIKEKFYLFDKKNIDSILDLIKIIDKTQFEIEVFEEKAKNIKITISKELKDKNYSIDSEKYKYISANLNLLNDDINNFCCNFIKNIQNIDKNLSFNISDESVSFFRKELEKYLNVFSLF